MLYFLRMKKIQSGSIIYSLLVNNSNNNNSNNNQWFFISCIQNLQLAILTNEIILNMYVQRGIKTI